VVPDSDATTASLARLALEVLRAKWKLEVVFVLARGRRRHCELQFRLHPVSKKVLSEVLRELERDGVVARRPSDHRAWSEYELTQLGWDLTVPVMALSDWGAAHAGAVAASRARPCSSAA
jgi:DNA-binding HxlR family transcriptional regulator